LYSIDAGYSLEQAEKYKIITEIKTDPIKQAEVPQLFEDLHLTTLVIFDLINTILVDGIYKKIKRLSRKGRSYLLIAQ